MNLKGLTHHCISNYSTESNRKVVRKLIKFVILATASSLTPQTLLKGTFRAPPKEFKVKIIFDLTSKEDLTICLTMRLQDFIHLLQLSHRNLLDISAQSDPAHNNAATAPRTNLQQDNVPSLPLHPTPPLPFAIHHVSCFICRLILQWQHIIVPPVAGFNYSHDAKAQAVAAITSSITKNYCAANLQMYRLSSSVAGPCVCGIRDKHLRKLLMLVFIILRWARD